MNDSAKIALIVAIAPTLLALIAVITGFRNSDKLKKLHLDLNSRLTELLLVTGARAREMGHAQGLAEGRSDGIKEEAARQKEVKR